MVWGSSADRMRSIDYPVRNTPPQWRIVCWNLAEAAMDEARRNGAVERLQTELERIPAALTRAKQALKKATTKKTIRRLGVRVGRACPRRVGVA